MLSCQHPLKFPTAKPLDFASRESELQGKANPFAAKWKLIQLLPTAFASSVLARAGSAGPGQPAVISRKSIACRHQASSSRSNQSLWSAALITASCLGSASDS